MADSDTVIRRGRPFEDSYAQRIITVIDDRVSRSIRSEAGVETTWGQVAGVSADGQTASAYLYGDLVNPSVGFRVQGAEVLTVGDKIKVAMSSRGEKYVTERLVTSAYRKVEIDLGTGEVRTGDGTAPPTARITSSGISVAHADLTGVTADQHHARSHDHSNAADDDTIAPTSITIPNTGTLTIGDVVLTRGAADRLDLASGDSVRFSDTGQLQWSDIALSRGAADRLDLATGDSFRLSDTGQLQWSDIVLSRGAANRLDFASGDSLRLSDTGELQWSDISLLRGAANRLDLASGDSLRLSDTGQLQWSDITLSRSAASALLLSAGDRFVYDFPGALVTRTGTQTITSGAYAAVDFTATDLSDQFAFHNPASNSTRITIPSGWGGTYYVWGNVEWDGNATGRRIAGFGKNGADPSLPGPRMDFIDLSATGFLQQVSGIMELADADYIELRVYQDSGTNRTLSANSVAGVIFLGVSA